MAKAVLELEAVTGNWDGGLRKAQTALQNFINTHHGLHQAMGEDNKTMATAIAKFGDLEARASTASGRLREMENMFVELGMRYHEMTSMEKLTPAGQRTIESMQKLKVQILDNKTAMKALQDQISTMNDTSVSSLSKLAGNNHFSFLKDADLTASKENMKGLVQTVQTLQNVFAELGAEEQKAIGAPFQAVLTDLQKKLSGLEERYGLVHYKQEEQKKDVNELYDAYVKLNGEYKSLTDVEKRASRGNYLRFQMNNLKKEISEAVSEMQRAEAETNKVSTAFDRLIKRDNFAFLKNVDMSGSIDSMQKLDNTIRILEQSYNKLSETDKRAQIGKDIITYSNELRTKLYQLEERFGALGVAVQETGKQIKQVSMQPSFGKQFASYLVPGFGLGAGAVAAHAAVAAVRKLGEAVRYGVETNIDFEQSNANLSAVLGKTRKEIESLTINAEKLGASTLFTANQITELQTVLARRGFNQQQILDMTHGISNLALATGTGLAEAAELAGATMQAFGMKATEMERIVSVLGVSTTKSALTTEKLGTALRYVAPNAKAAGYSLEDTVAMLGVLVDAGLEASMAGTSLRQIIMAMSTENGKLARSFGHPIRGMQDFIAAIQEISTAEDVLSDMSEEVRVTAVPAMIALADNKGRIEELRKSLEGVNEELQKMADKQEDTLRGSITLLKSAWDGLLLSMGQGRTGWLKSGNEKLAGFLNDVSKSEKLKQGGAAALSVVEYAPEVAQKAASGTYKTLSGKGYSDENIARVTTQNLEEAQRKFNELFDLLLYYYTPGDNSVSGDRINEIKHNRHTTHLLGENGYNNLLLELRDAKLSLDTNKSLLSLVSKDVEAEKKKVAQPIKEILEGAIREAQTALDKETDITKIPELKKNLENARKEYDKVFGNNTAQKATQKETEEEKIEKRRQEAEKRYARAYSLIADTEEAGLKDSIAANRERVSAEERLANDYYELYQDTNDVRFLDEWKALAETIKDFRETIRHQQEEMAADADALRADRMVAAGVQRAVGQSAWDRIAQSGTEGEALYGRFTQMKAGLIKGIQIPDDVWRTFETEVNEKLAELHLPPIKIDLETGSVVKMADEVKNMSAAWNYASQAISSVGTAMSSLEDPSAKVAGIIAGAIASMAAGLGGAIAQKGKEGLEPWSWIAFTAASTATLISSVAAVKKAVEYHANGGIVGSLFQPRGTDTVPAMLTPGEEVLSLSDPRHRRNLPKLQAAGGYGDLHMEKIITGEDIRIVLTNNARRRGGTGKNYAI